MTQVKGHIIYLTKQYILEKHGEEEFDRVLSKLSQESKDIVSGTITSSNDYDINVDFQLISAFDTLYGRVELLNLARYKVDKEITGFFGLILKFVSPDKVIARSQEMWDKMYSAGKCSFVKKSEGNYLCTITGFEHDDHYMYMILYYLHVFVEKVFGKKVLSTAKRLNKNSVEYAFNVATG
jgi:hypothetical protein